jgi:hypothetical protein
MDKRKLHHYWKRLTGVHYGFFLGLCLISGITAVVALRNNNQHMIVLRDKVFQADKDNGDVETALRNLRGYVYGHMNTDLSSGNNPVKPPIQLKYRYERLIAASKTTAEADKSKIYSDAQAYCEKLYPGSFYGGPRVPCISNYVDQHKVPDPQPIPDDLYKFDFVSPGWTPDLAGISLLLTALFFLLFIASALSDRLLRYELKK